MKTLIIFLSIILNCTAIITSAEGYLVIVGGGSEKPNGWSDEPYSWAVEKSENKRVAIITYDTEVSNWLPDYFEDLGAAEAKNFIINNSSIADLQETYDSLVTYNIIFFKGGNQWKYYDYYKNTLTHEAVQYIFDNGGVICGTSAGLAVLSGIVFTAENGSVYSDEALEDPFNNYMTLENDFFNFMPGYLFDSHFVERARFGRLIGFMGNWNISTGEDIIGIGVDDKTAFCIDLPDGTGFAFGTGAVNFYLAQENNNFRISGEKLLASSIEVKQLLNGCSINLNTLEYEGLSTQVIPEYEAIAYQNELWLSGSDKIYHNTMMLEHFTNSDPIQDTILIITGISTSLAGFYEDYLNGDLQTPTLVMQALQSNVADPLWKDRIQRVSKFLFIDNAYSTLMSFLNTWPNGNLLKDHVKTGEKKVAFVGDNSRYAGQTVLVNYDEEYASYDGLLEFDAGLGLFRNGIVMPKTFSSDIDNENASAGVPFGMVLDHLKYGFWLYDDCYLYYNPQDDHAEITSIGDFPMIMIENPGTMADFSTMPATNTNEPRDVAGFGEFNLMLIDSSVTKTVSLVESISVMGEKDFETYPNPAKNVVYLKPIHHGQAKITVFDPSGQVVNESFLELPATLDISKIKPGIYLIKANLLKSNKTFSSKIIIQ